MINFSLTLNFISQCLYPYNVLKIKVFKTQGGQNPKTALLRHAFEGPIQKNKLKRSCPTVIASTAEYEWEIVVNLKLAEPGSLSTLSGKQITRVA